jgi:hypothetical protein
MSERPFIDWPAIVSLVREHRLSVRLCPTWEVEDGECGPWTTFLIVPTRGYLESSCGPVPYRDVAWLDVQTLRQTHRGNRLAPLIEDLEAVVIKRLQAMAVRFARLADDGGVRIASAGATVPEAPP